LKATGVPVAGGFYIARVRTAKTTSVAFAAVVLAFALPMTFSAAPASAATCGAAVPYPGDAAAPEQIANWMANGAIALNLPAELPIMAALVESGMKNLNYGDADSLGYFQMRTSIWNKGAYKGYPTNAPLQLKWFTDTAASVQFSRKSNSKPDPASDQALFGEWIADIERPASQYRGRYQLRLADARKLVSATCPELLFGNRGAPATSLKVALHQHPVRSKALSASVLCPKAACNVGVSAAVSISGRKRSIKLATDTAMLGPAKRRVVKLPVHSGVRSRIKTALARGRSVRARLRLRIAGTNGVAVVKIYKLRLLR
jgi:hypothetical protein